MSTIVIKEVSLSKDLLETIREIDLQFYPNIGSIDWYLERYKPCHYAFAAMDKGIIVGYAASLPVRKELYDSIINGVLVDDTGINPDMYVEESDYYYLVSVLLKEEYRGLNLSRKLMDALINRYKNKKMCTLAITAQGYHMVEHYFSLVKIIDGNIGIFSRN